MYQVGFVNVSNQFQFVSFPLVSKKSVIETTAVWPKYVVASSCIHLVTEGSIQTSCSKSVREKDWAEGWTLSKLLS